MTIELANKRLEEIDNTLTALGKERVELMNFIQLTKREQAVSRVRAWNISTDSFLVLFAKQPSGYHWWIAKAIKVKNIDFDNEYIESIVTSYGEADYEYYVKSELVRISFSSLEQLEKEFNIYIVSEEEFSMLQSQMLNLELDYKNYDEYQERYASNAFMSIKISKK